MKIKSFLIFSFLALLTLGIEGCGKELSVDDPEPTPEEFSEQSPGTEEEITINAQPDESPPPEITNAEPPLIVSNPEPSETGPEPLPPPPISEAPPTPEPPTAFATAFERCHPAVALSPEIVTAAFFRNPSLSDRLRPSPVAAVEDLDRLGRIALTDVTTLRKPLPCVIESNTETPPSPLHACTIGSNDLVTFTQGQNGGFGQSSDPAHPFDIIFGPPKGTGAYRGSLDVLSLGRGGEIVVEFTDCSISNGDGPDFTVFENAFNNFVEPGFVSVSEDGVHFFEFPCNPTTRPYEGCAGITPVYANADPNSAHYNSIDPWDPDVSGGDAFDLADVGLTMARFIKIRDALSNAPVGPSTGGFDLDAITIINGILH